MNRINTLLIERFKRINSRYLPFADAASEDLPLDRLLRLALFQVGVAMAAVLLLGTLNRVMIVELGIPASVVAVIVSLPFLFAPFRALIGFKSDGHRSAFGWRRVPYVWAGTMLQFGGLSIMPFALLLLSGDGEGPAIIGQIGAVLAFLLVGAGVHITQTAGLALASDLAAPETRPRVVALMYVVFLLGSIVSGYAFSFFLADFSAVRLIQVIQGAAVLTLLINVVAFWKQEPRSILPPLPQEAPDFRKAWKSFVAQQPATRRFLVALGIGTAAFSMQDIILEPYGAEVLGLSVSETTLLTALQAVGSLAAFALAANLLARGVNAFRLAAVGVMCGIVAFSFVIISGALLSPGLFRLGVVMIGFGGGLFSVSTLMAAMSLESGGLSGLALGAWGAVQATATGLSMALGGIMRDGVAAAYSAGYLGSAFAAKSSAYGVVYHMELLFLFITLIAIGPLVRLKQSTDYSNPQRLQLAEFPA